MINYIEYQGFINSVTKVMFKKKSNTVEQRRAEKEAAILPEKNRKQAVVAFTAIGITTLAILLITVVLSRQMGRLQNRPCRHKR